MDWQVWLAFAGAALVLSLAPGPDNIFVLMQSVIYGKNSGLKVVSGLCSGLLVHTFLIAVGLSALIRSSQYALLALKCAGAAYLVYLAVMAWKAPAIPLSEEKGLHPVKSENSFGKWWLRGFLMNLTNPKVIIFFLALFPQFISPERNYEIQVIIMGLTFICATIIVFGGVAYFAELVRRKVRSPSVQRAINRTGAGVFVALATSLLFTK